ncbi:protein phosphatase 2C domain-containing protein [Gloeothece verrucosa]|uniref:Protein serine/threonine phosphatase n=1 Tax=Gloeothece verrucosa (strain PCC 7822) TaxID=497965 RepID=E0U754_GLOV7|nr:protein phosphatase 2C domain-containing protein [Gloeothece verrucosa]ADN17210.1 protein serine/threonine phosphatase [Gloeothece verrucosa PCC 7822]
MKEFPLVVNLEIIRERGEDAHLALSFSKNSDTSETVVMAVFDGLGGRSAGYNGLTGGKIASQEAVQKTESFLKQWQGKITQDKVFELQDTISRNLKQKADTNLKPSKLKGSLVQKRLCTTLALASISQQDNYCNVNIAWIGDSRIYFLNPEKGLQQLTVDDLIIEKDAFEMIREDPPMSQYFTADMEANWRINFKSEQFEERGCIIACTDGGFQYLTSPWDFERLLLETLNRANTPLDWQDLLFSKYEEIKQDDVSLILYPIGFNDFEFLKNAYQARLKTLDQFNEQSSYDDLYQIWNKYRINYEAKLHTNNHEDIQIQNSNTWVVEFKENKEKTSDEDSICQPINSNSLEIDSQKIDDEIDEDFNKEEFVKADRDETQIKIQELHEEGRKYCESKQWYKAIEVYQQLIKLEPAHIKGNLNLGIAYRKLYRFREAVECFNKIIEQKKEHYLAAILEIIIIYDYYQDYKNIVPFFDEVIKIPNHSIDLIDEDSMVIIATSLQKTGKLQDALNICQQIHEYDPRNPYILYLMGLINHQQQNLVNALKYLYDSYEIYHREYDKTRRSDLQKMLSIVNKEIKRVESDRGNTY